ncbi:MAG TPA: hypothetical protein VLG76_07130 [Rhabdochlamydiaceae bacterium]|nr:hypothetical protein [Rhabdochlamydiaceae bacterium]
MNGLEPSNSNPFSAHQPFDSNPSAPTLVGRSTSHTLNQDPLLAEAEKTNSFITSRNLGGAVNQEAVVNTQPSRAAAPTPATTGSSSASQPNPLLAQFFNVIKEFHKKIPLSDILIKYNISAAERSEIEKYIYAIGDYFHHERHGPVSIWTLTEICDSWKVDQTNLKPIIELVHARQFKLIYRRHLENHKAEQEKRSASSKPISQKAATPSTLVPQSSAPEVSKKQKSDFWADEVTIYEPILVEFEEKDGKKEVSDIVEEFGLLEKVDPNEIRNYICAMADYWDNKRFKKGRSPEEICNDWQVDQTKLKELLKQAKARFRVKSCKRIYSRYLEEYKSKLEQAKAASPALVTTERDSSHRESGPTDVANLVSLVNSADTNPNLPADLSIAAQITTSTSSSSSSIASSATVSHPRPQQASKGKRKAPATATPVAQSSLEVSKKRRQTVPFEKIIITFRENGGKEELSDIVIRFGGYPQRAIYQAKDFISVMVACVVDERTNGGREISDISDEKLRKHCSEKNLSPKRILNLLPEARLHLAFYENYTLGKRATSSTVTQSSEVSQRQTLDDRADLVALANLAAAAPNLPAVPVLVAQSTTSSSSSSIASSALDRQPRSQQLSKRQKLEEEEKKVIIAFQESNGEEELSDIIKKFPSLKPTKIIPIRRNINVIAACLHHENTHNIIFSNESDADLQNFCPGQTSAKKILRFLLVARPSKDFYVNLHKSNLEKNLKKKSKKKNIINN